MILRFPPVAPGPFGLSGFANSINDKGQIVGQVQGQGRAGLPGIFPLLWAEQGSRKWPSRWLLAFPPLTFAADHLSRPGAGQRRWRIQGRVA
jgi:hypothetical protein